MQLHTQGDIVPTSTGGSQVVFDDVEILKQESPTNNRGIENISPNRRSNRRSKRSFEELGIIERTGMGGVGR